ncbi:MAG: hypothetical protein M1142_00340 [Patescibacteria group bacterium]|nr:hypothetical protein [Patescibacteria group bacterium]
MLDNFTKHRLNFILIVGIIFFIAGGFFAYQKFFNKQVTQAADSDVQETDLAFDPERAYALLSPRRDGNAAVLDLKRTASYQQISYELTYMSEGIDRGVMGKIDTNQKRGEYQQEILFGTCSKNICKYDTGVENGTLTLHIKRDNQAFRMVTQWHLQQPDVVLGVLTSGDNHFTYKIDPDSTDLSLIKYTIINDLSGMPKLESNKTVVGKVYAVNAPSARDLPAGTVTVELADNPTPDSKIAKFDDAQNKWVEYDTKIDGSKLTASVDGGGIFAVLTPQKSN